MVSVVTLQSMQSYNPPDSEDQYQTHLVCGRTFRRPIYSPGSSCQAIDSLNTSNSELKGGADDLSCSGPAQSRLAEALDALVAGIELSNHYIITFTDFRIYKYMSPNLLGFMHVSTVCVFQHLYVVWNCPLLGD